MINFYDTCSLLARAEDLFNKDEEIAISSITLQELEHIKTSSNKDECVKFNARKLLHDIDNNLDKIQIILYKETYGNIITQNDFELTNDTKILATAINYKQQKQEDLCFITNDLSLKMIAKCFLSNVSSVEENEENPYSGYEEVILSDDEMAFFYNHLDENIYNLLTNEYLIVKDKDGNIVDKMCWRENKYQHIEFRTFSSTCFGDMKPIKGDVYQAFLFDSLARNKITLVKGCAGSGKSIISLGYLMDRLEHGRLDKIIIFCNTVPVKGAAELGLIIG